MDYKQVIHRYLTIQRDALLAKLDGLGERDVRWPMTRTGTNLLGLVTHVASVELDDFLPGLLALIHQVRTRGHSIASASASPRSGGCTSSPKRCRTGPQRRP